MVDSISIQFAMVDFTNPEAREWIKDIIKQNLVNERHYFNQFNFIPLKNKTKEQFCLQALKKLFL